MVSRRASDSVGELGLPSHAELVKVLAASVEEIFDAMLISMTAGVKQLSCDTNSDPDCKARQLERGVDLEVAVAFAGALNGSVVLRCSNQGALDIARGLLMMEEGDLDLEEVKDALGEYANLVTGSLKAKALDPIADFSMGAPVVIEPSEESRLNSEMIFELTSGVMSAELWIDNQSRDA